MFRWLDETIEDARRAAAYGPGADGGVHALHRGNDVGDIDARTRDLELKQLRALRSSVNVQLGHLVDKFRQDAETIVGATGLRAG